MKRRHTLHGVLYAAVLVWVNGYICRNWFYHPTAAMNSIHGCWAALARFGGSWLHPSWWPFWDFGMPREFTYTPLVPAATGWIAAWRGVSPLLGLGSVSAIVYCAAPLALFLLAWRLTRAPEYSFFAALLYSLASPGALLAPETPLPWDEMIRPQRLMLQTIWDETPRYAALAFLLLFLLFLVHTLERPSAWSRAAAGVTLALSMLASPFGALSAAIGALCLLTARQAKLRSQEMLQTGAIALTGYCLAARFVPPSFWIAMGSASAAHQDWNAGALKVVCAVAVVWLTLEHYLPRWTTDWRTRFLVLFAFATSYAPILSFWLDWQILPQPRRFRIEMDAALALLIVFGVRPLIRRLPHPATALLVLVLFFFAGKQVVFHRRLAKDVLYPADVTKTIEYRTAQRVSRELPGVRVMLPGSIAHWANAFTDIQQFSGSEGTTAYSQIQQRAMTAVYQDGGRESIAWLKAFGTGAVVVSNAASSEFWKPYANPSKFDGLLPVLWAEDGVTAYRVPAPGGSLARVVPESALIVHEPSQAEATSILDHYNDSSTPASFEWLTRNAFRVRGDPAAGQAISVQVSYHPGWHASIDGRAALIHRDGLGMMWVRPDRPGRVAVEMRYDGGWELRLSQCAGVLALGTVIFSLLRGAVR